MQSQQSPHVAAYLLTDIGHNRPVNEDFVGYFVPDDPQDLASDGQLFVVADGAGGKGAGDVASQYAVRKLLHHFYDASEPDLERRLVESVRVANADLYEYAITSNKPNMSTTLVVVHIRGSQLRVANVGNSRAYLLRDGSIEQITRDHSLVEQLIREGAITRQEARANPPKNALLRSLGSESSVAVDVFASTLRSSDNLVLCSDGLTRYVGDAEIAQVVAQEDSEDACRKLVDLASQRGGDDDISVIVLSYDPLAVPSLQEMVSGTKSEPVTLSAQVNKGPTFSQMGATSSAATGSDTGRDLTGRPKTLSALPEPVSVRDRAQQLPWRTIGYGAGLAVLGVLVVLLVGVVLPRIGIRIGVSSDDTVANQSFDLPATIVSTTATPAEDTVISTATSGALLADGTPPAIGLATALPAELITPTPAPTIDPDLTGPVEIFEGEFFYGATANQSNDAVQLCRDLGGTTCLAEFFEDAEPPQRIEITRYFIDRTEVTNQAYRACVDEGACQEPEGLDAEGLGIADYYLNVANDNYPVVGVTWQQASAYCRWADGRLPTEAEWEKAAGWDFAANQKRVWPWGNAWDASRVNYRDTDPVGGGPESVGSRPGNISAFGVFDMAGNVSEWVADWYAPDYYETLDEGQVDPTGPASPGADRFRVIRGGSWEDNGVFSRTVHRLLAPETHFNKSIGFRCSYDIRPGGPAFGAGASDAPPLIPADSTQTP